MDPLIIIFVSTLVILAILGIICWIKCKSKAKKMSQESFENLKVSNVSLKETDDTKENNDKEDNQGVNSDEETKSILKKENSPSIEKTVRFKEFDVMNIGKTNSSAYGTIETYNKYDPKYNNVFDTVF